jgi:hypothetical protein
MQVWLWILTFVALVFATAALGVLSRRPKRASIPIADTKSLRRPSRRTSVLRASCAVTATGLVAAGLALLPLTRPRRAAAKPLPSTVVVLDVSSSISPVAFAKIASTLETIAGARGERRTGLVIFSDVAYQALPPEAPQNELRRFARYFERIPTASRTGRSAFPARPWAESFSGGTVISNGLRLARTSIHRNGVPRAVVLLVSDLADAPSDWDPLHRELAAYSRDRTLTLRAVPLPPSSPGDWVRRMLGPARVAASSAAGDVLVRPLPRRDSRLQAFAALVVLVGLVLTVNELLSARLAWKLPEAGSAAGTS